MEDEPKLSEVLEAVKDGFELMDRRFDGVDQRLDRMENRMDKQEGKMNVLVNVLQQKNVITEDDKRNVHA